MAKGKLTWEWSDRGNNEIIVRKARGKITIQELQEFLNEGRNYDSFAGMLAVAYFRINGSEYLFDGYDGEESDGDSVILCMAGDDTPCPICGRNDVFVQYCPQCGEPLFRQKGGR